MVVNIDATRNTALTREGEWSEQKCYVRYTFEPGDDSKIQTDPMETAGFEYAIILWDPDSDGTRLDFDKTSYLAYDVKTGTKYIKENPEGGVVIATDTKAGYIGPGCLPANLVIETPCDGRLVVELHSPVNRRDRNV